VKTACCTSPNRISVLSRLRRVGSASATYGGSRAQLSIPRTGETTCRVAPCNRKVKEFGQAVSSRADFSLIVQVLSETSLCTSLEEENGRRVMGRVALRDGPELALRREADREGSEP